MTKKSFLTVSIGLQITLPDKPMCICRCARAILFPPCATALVRTEWSQYLLYLQRSTVKCHSFRPLVVSDSRLLANRRSFANPDSAKCCGRVSLFQHQNDVGVSLAAFAADHRIVYQQLAQDDSAHQIAQRSSLAHRNRFGFSHSPRRYRPDPGEL